MCYHVLAMVHKLSSDERGRIAEKLMELGNLVLAALVVGQIISERPENLISAGVGIAIFVGLYFCGYQIMKRG